MKSIVGIIFLFSLSHAMDMDCSLILAAQKKFLFKLTDTQAPAKETIAYMRVAKISFSEPVPCDEFLRTPLQLALHYKNRDLIDFLIDQKVDVDYQDTRQKTALMKMSGAPLDLFHKLMDLQPDLSKSDAQGNTALHIFIKKADKYNNYLWLDELCKYPLDLAIKNNTGLTPFDYAYHHLNNSAAAEIIWGKLIFC